MREALLSYQHWLYEKSMLSKLPNDDDDDDDDDDDV